jgi:hypothetical protein
MVPQFGGRVGDSQAVLAGSANPVEIGWASGSPLGTIAKFDTPPPFRGRGDAAIHRFMLQSAARELVPGERVAKCLRVPAGSGVDVFYAPAARSAHYGGLQTCGSIWMCPVCASKISERRRLELAQALTAHNGLVVLATFTVQHRASHALSTLLEGFLASLRRLRLGKPWQKIESRFDISGVIRAVEVTHGSNGWHPHAHLLFFLPGGTETLTMSLFGAALRCRWLGLLARTGLSASWAAGVDVRAADDAVGDYVAKFGAQWTVAHELTKAAVKKTRSGAGRSMADLLSDYALNSDAEAGRLWREYALLFRGKKHLVWSRGLRDRLLGDVDELTDEELANKHDQVAVVLATLTLRQWSVVVANDARAELLTVASSGDVVQLIDFLVALGVEMGWP